MATHSRVQNYLDRYKIGPLFEELMNRVIQDMPDEPLLFLIKLLYKKVGKPIPEDLKFTAMRKSTSDMHRSVSPDVMRKSRSGPVSAWTVNADQDQSIKDRTYDKPWLSHSRKMGKSRRSDDIEAEAGRTSKTEWNTDVKVTPIKAEDPLQAQPGDDHSPERRSRLARGRAHQSRSIPVPQPVRNIDTSDDPLAGEIPVASRVTDRELDGDGDISSTRSNTRTRGRKLDAEKHKQDLQNRIQDAKEASIAEDSGIGEAEDDTPDDALELLESADDLKREGITNVSSKGVKLSQIMRDRSSDSEVKLNINLYASPRPVEAGGEKYGGRFADLDQQWDSEQEKNNGADPIDNGDSDEEFESVSQVTGPRRPVWHAEESEDDTVPRPALRSPSKSKTMPAQIRSDSPAADISWNQKLRTAPVASHDIHTRSSAESDGFLRQSPATQSPVPDEVTPRGVDLHGASAAGGWQIPDGSDVSVVTNRQRRGH